MEVAALILEFVKVVIYPTIILIIAFSFQKQLKLLLSGQLKASYKDLTFTIEKQKQIIENITLKQEIVAEKIESEVKKISEEQNMPTVTEHLLNLVSFLKFDHYESLVLKALKKRGGTGKLSVLWGDWSWDPWDEHKEEMRILSAVKALKLKNIIVEDEGLLQVTHKSFLDLVT